MFLKKCKQFLIDLIDLIDLNKHQIQNRVYGISALWKSAIGYCLEIRALRN